jgi:LmbE family N-acetylglucosaminyl deacetylase
MMNYLLNSSPKVLVLAPHTDDAELGCGGSIARFLESSCEVHVAAFSTAEDSLPPGWPSTTLRDEFLDAMRLLGVAEQNTIVFDYPVRRLSYYRQEVLEELVKLRKRIQPDLVLLPSASDVHQDHQVVFAEGMRVFKDITVWGYELPWNHISFSAQAFVVLGAPHLETKWCALQAYKSQLALSRPYFCRAFMEGLARMRGVQVKAEFAEAFEVVRVKW